MALRSKTRPEGHLKVERRAPNTDVERSKAEIIFLLVYAQKNSVNNFAKFDKNSIQMRKLRSAILKMHTKTISRNLATQKFGISPQQFKTMKQQAQKTAYKFRAETRE